MDYKKIIGRAKELFTIEEEKTIKFRIMQAVNELVTNEEIRDLASGLDITKDDLIDDIYNKMLRG